MTFPRVLLGEVVEILSGFAFKSELFNDGEGMPLIRIRDVVRGYSDTFYSGSYTNQYVVQNGEIVIGMDGNFNTARWNGGPALLNQRVCKIFAKPEKLDDGYLFHFLPSVLKKIEDATPFVTVKHLSATDLRTESIPLPPLEEQRRIAAILDQADALRTKCREALAQLDSLTQSIFIEMFGEYSLGKIAWPCESFEQIAIDTKIGLVRSAEEFGTDFDVPYVRMNAISRAGEFLDDLVLRTNVSAAELKDYLLKPGDLLFNTRNSKELVGKTALFREQGAYVYNNNLMRIRFRDGIEPEYVAAAFQTPYVQHELEIRKAGTTSVFAIYARALKSLPVPVPPTALQRAFSTRINAVETLKAQHRFSLCDLSNLFASLQHRAFRGEL